MKKHKKANEQIDIIIKTITSKELCAHTLALKMLNLNAKQLKKILQSVEKQRIYSKRRYSQAVIQESLSASTVQAYSMRIVLRVENPSPYGLYENGDDEIISANPKLNKIKDGKLTTFPLAGSRPRGKTRQEDLMLEKSC